MEFGELNPFLIVITTKDMWKGELLPPTLQQGWHWLWLRVDGIWLGIQIRHFVWTLEEGQTS
jgi:hypothetical protein